MGLDDITRRIRAAESAAGRAPGSVTLIAVSKLQPSERVEAVLAAGHTVFGENYVQEAQAKWPAWTAAHPGVSVHMIGPLQSNKARAAVALATAGLAARGLGEESQLAPLAESLKTGEVQADRWLRAWRDDWSGALAPLYPAASL